MSMHGFLRTIVYFILLSAAPLSAHSAIMINEVAWMGTHTSPNHEWIELHNTGPSVVDLDGWRLRAVDGSPNISLSGSIAPGAYFLLERTSDESVPGIPADLIYTGVLGNSGEILELYNDIGVLIDRVDGSDNWSIGGDNTTKDTLQRVGSGWVTARPTPRAPNTTEMTEVKSGDEKSDISATGATAATLPSRVVEPTLFDRGALTRVTDPYLSVTVGGNRAAQIGAPVTFGAEAQIGSRALLDEGAFVWYMGDGTRKVGRNVSHVYQYPGVYIVAVEARSTLFLEDKRAHDTIEVTVSPPSVSVSDIAETYIELKNEHTDRVDLSGMKLTLGAQVITLPPHTYLPGSGSVRFLRSALSVPIGVDMTNVVLFSSAGYPVARYDQSDSAMLPRTSAPAQGTSSVTDQADSAVAASLARLTQPVSESASQPSANASAPPSSFRPEPTSSLAVPVSPLAESIAAVTEGYMNKSETQPEYGAVASVREYDHSQMAAVAGALPARDRDMGLFAWVIVLLAIVAGASVLVLSLGRPSEVVGAQVSPNSSPRSFSDLSRSDCANMDASFPRADEFTIIEGDTSSRADK